MFCMLLIYYVCVWKYIYTHIIICIIVYICILYLLSVSCLPCRLVLFSGVCSVNKLKVCVYNAQHRAATHHFMWLVLLLLVSTLKHGIGHIPFISHVENTHLHWYLVTLFDKLFVIINIHETYIFISFHSTRDNINCYLKDNFGNCSPVAKLLIYVYIFVCGYVCLCVRIFLCVSFGKIIATVTMNLTPN